ncbi:hypothetical protein Cgig2_006552 [Carnegiea gigantea]|uniref:Exonuclease 1 n=1 Tax=Carnegiea gigantea TaxID=171969 RepID=A0A9Q1JUW7_9CARY|nr:hypothetical protein Cgig2_006552 [Carnegiea gigantea]
MSPIHMKELGGFCVAVDTYSWLHKGALSCSAELCKGLPTSRHIDYCMHNVNMLRHHGVKPILVFDGGLLPMKSKQENKRASESLVYAVPIAASSIKSRKENLARAIEHESSGNSAAAYECYQRSLDISPAIAYDLIQVLKREGVDYIVAPYEADAQMAFLAITKQVDAVITEDSDLIAFGCPRDRRRPPATTIDHPPTVDTSSQPPPCHHHQPTLAGTLILETTTLAAAPPLLRTTTKTHQPPPKRTAQHSTLLVDPPPHTHRP